MCIRDRYIDMSHERTAIFLFNDRHKWITFFMAVYTTSFEVGGWGITGLNPTVDIGELSDDSNGWNGVHPGIEFFNGRQKLFIDWSYCNLHKTQSKVSNWEEFWVEVSK